MRYKAIGLCRETLRMPVPIGENHALDAEPSAWSPIRATLDELQQR